MSRARTERDVVIRQIANMSSHFYIIDDNIHAAHNINEKDNKVGQIIKFTHRDFVRQYYNIIKENQYHILLNDESIVNFYYEFDDNGKIIKHCLYYIPCPDREVFEYFMSSKIDEESLDSDILAKLYKGLERYIRIDCDLIGKQKYVHTMVHIHFGIGGDGTRLPINTKIFPEEFLYLIMRYVYCSDSPGVENLCLNSSKIIQLDADELNKFYFLIGSNNL